MDAFEFDDVLLADILDGAQGRQRIGQLVLGEAVELRIGHHQLAIRESGAVCLYRNVDRRRQIGIDRKRNRDPGGKHRHGKLKHAHAARVALGAVEGVAARARWRRGRQGRIGIGRFVRSRKHD
ncbi:hypothetical protein [Mesorhizobium sp. LNJC374B00]|uniref:hypothetical protein n=1 Tax=Mesorhizobium sp. LNJC374B00 TaxID=1287258 RepID=UPI001FDA8AF7|nr:hypothetical protein [Mesorhizobium sp. LNJC374B00]